MTTPVADRFSAVRARIERACLRSRRPVDELTLVAVSKRQPLERLRQAIAVGQRVLGESQVQEALVKSAELPAGLDWHLIGPLQSNKAKKAVSLFGTIHSLDRAKILRRVDREARAQAKVVNGFIQVNIGREKSKHGFAEEEVEELGGLLGELQSLRIVGLMAIPPYEENPEATRPWFRRLRELRDRLLVSPQWKGFSGWLSMGMSHDFEIAIEEGATHVRVGSCLFGSRS